MELHPSPPRIQRVPQQLLDNTKVGVYEPLVVSLGPYHHNCAPRLKVAEDLKPKILKTFVSESGREELFFMGTILERIDDIRDCYVGISEEKFTNHALARMMLLDSCFVIYFMGDHKNESNLARHLGIGVAFLNGDLCMLENQVPLFVIRLLMKLIYDHDQRGQGEKLLCKYLSQLCFGDDRLKSIHPLRYGEEEPRQPLHLLEAQRRILLQGHDYHHVGNGVQQPRGNWVGCRPTRWLRERECTDGEVCYKKLSLPFYSATELKSKGIHFRPSSTACFKDISFQSYWCYGQLKLPIWLVTNSSKVLFLNMIAYEMTPESNTDFEVTSYINFMKALVKSLEDVKQLRQNGILFSIIGSEDEVVEVYREINTYGLGNEHFLEVKWRIEQHCASKAKTWTMMLFYSRFRTPWAVIGFLAAIYLLMLTSLQAYFTTHRRPN